MIIMGLVFLWGLGMSKHDISWWLWYVSCK